MQIALIIGRGHTVKKKRSEISSITKLVKHFIHIM